MNTARMIHQLWVLVLMIQSVRRADADVNEDQWATANDTQQLVNVSGLLTQNHNFPWSKYGPYIVDLYMGI